MQKQKIGIFKDGSMLTTDKEIISIPPNYTSKSKLLNGDVLMYHPEEREFKQINPVEREYHQGEVIKPNNLWRVLVDTKAYKFSDAARNYNNLKEGDLVNISLPLNTETEWCAIENKIEFTELEEEDYERILSTNAPGIKQLKEELCTN